MNCFPILNFIMIKDLHEEWKNTDSFLENATELPYLSDDNIT
jgi:hypothetical protein